MKLRWFVLTVLNLTPEFSELYHILTQVIYTCTICCLGHYKCISVVCRVRIPIDGAIVFVSGEANAVVQIRQVYLHCIQFACLILKSKHYFTH